MSKYLENVLNEYLSQKDVDGAFYIDGPWGSGKSFFIKSFQKSYNEANKKEKQKTNPCLYVSLNGLSDVDAINAELFSQCHPRFSKISNSKLTKSLFNFGGFVGNFFGFDSKKAIKDLSNGITSWFENKCSVLILDDFERCRIDLQELFGYISSLITDSKIKVILIGNDVEVRRYLQEESVYKAKSISAQISNDLGEYEKNLSKVSEPLIYDSIKEKCIYRTHYFQFDETILFDTLIAKYPESMRSLVEKNRDEISSILSRNKCNNLRTCKVALENYYYIMSNIQHSFSCEEEVRTAVLLSTFLCTVQCKNGKAEGTFSEKTLTTNNYVYPIKGIEKYVYNSVWNRDAILKELIEVDKDFAIKKSKELPRPLKELDGVWYFKTDDQIKDEIYRLKESLDSVPPLYYCKTLSCFFTYKQWFEDEKIDIDQITERLIQIIKSSEKEVDLDEAFMWVDTYPKELTRNLKRLKEECRKRNIVLGNKTYFSMDPSALKSYSLDDLKKIDRDSYNYKCFFSRIDINQLKNTIEKCDSATIFNIRTFLQNVYRVSDINKYFKDDLPSLKEFQAYLASYKGNSVLKTKTISLLKNDVDEYIKAIDLD